MSPPRSEETDVLIAGAGPAGCAAGILLARRGIRVSILEKRSAEHHKICGDLLGPRTHWLLEEMGLGRSWRTWVGTPIRSIQIYDGQRLRSWAPFERADRGVPPAETLRRDRFDRWLRARAEEAGCRVLYRTWFRGIEPGTRDFLSCLASSSGGTDRRFEARMLLGADGTGSRVARAASLRACEPRSRILAARAYFRNVAGLRDSIELYFLPRYFPGYAWVIPLGDGVANVGLGMRADACRRKRLRLPDEVARFVREHPALARRMRRAEPEGPARGWSIGGYQPGGSRTGRRVLLLGDAGGLADPLSGEGIYSALKSACLAMPFVLRAFETGDFSRGFLSGYDRALRAHFGGSYRYGMRLSSFPSDGRLLGPIVRWGLGRVENHALMDAGYARNVGGFFAGMVPGNRMMNARWFLRTLFG